MPTLVPGLEDFRSSGPASQFISCSHHAQKGERGMAHAISARLARLAARIGQAGLDRDNQTAARHGWQARQIRPGTWRYRDSRFGQPHTTATMAGRRL